MPLEFKISNPQVSDTGKDILIRDVTGVYNAVTNPGGYGFPNHEIGDILLYHVELSHLSLKEVYTQVQGRTGTPPEVITQPSVNSIANGSEPISLNSYGLGIDPSLSTKTFGDGVYNLDVSVVISASHQGTGSEGDIFIVSPAPDPALQNLGADVIYVGGTIYDIDKSKNTDTGLVVYLTEPLKEDISSFQVGYKANAKVTVDLSVRTCLTRKAVKGNCSCQSKTLDTWVDYLNSGLAFGAGDYAAANDLILSAGEICRGGCGC